MSVFLYRLGSLLARFRGRVVGAWVLVLAAVVGASMMLGEDYDSSFSIPGTQSQEGLELVQDRFGQSGTAAQIIFTADSGAITDAANAQAVKKVAAAVNQVPRVDMSNPLGPPPGQSKPVLSSDKASTLGSAPFVQATPSDATLEAVQKAARPPVGSGISTSVGGDAYSTSSDPSRVPELIGLTLSFLILAVTFGSFVAAGMPIVSAVIGVGATISAVAVLSNVVSVSSSAPSLAEMLGLAVGIDYALFLLSRYRRQLDDPAVSPAVAMSRALATAGSAVVFAGTTVIIALLGLAVARIPVLTVMGLSAAAAVAVAVTVALTLVPSLALLFGERLRPRLRRGGEPRRRLRRRKKQAAPAREQVGFPTRWVRFVTAVPLLTIVVVVGILLLAAFPATKLDLALGDNGSAPAGTPERVTYDDITRAFGEGYNAPLTVTAGVITSENPTKTVNQLATAMGKLSGVTAVPQASPNQSGDTALFQVIPTAGQNAPSTGRLVGELRDQSSALEKKYGVTDMLVTGPTAVNIDVSDRLTGALLPFAAIVVGLSLVLLMIVFRSVAVPLKATLGYLLSVGAALGAVVAVFQWGWLESVAPSLNSGGTVVSFLPIFVMGVLFGLAMDYEMFLVSAMREAYVESGDARAAIFTGFRASSVVVTAAALIMTSVFTAFVPGGSTTIMPIAFGLAVGVFVDAFLVRMTLVPAVLMLLGRWAWWLPRWLDARIPAVDVEGAAMHRKVNYEDWERAHGTAALVGRDVVVRPGTTPVDVRALPTEMTPLSVPEDLDPVELALVLVGRQHSHDGELIVGGLLLPEQRESVHTTAAYVEVGRAGDERSVAEQVDERARLSAVSRRRRSEFAAEATALAEGLQAAAESVGGRPGPVGRAATRSAVVEAAMAVAGGVRLLVLIEEGPESNVPAGTAQALGEELSREDITVVLLRPEVWREPTVEPASAAGTAGGRAGEARS